MERIPKHLSSYTLIRISITFFNVMILLQCSSILLPTHASEQGTVIGFVSIYIHIYT